MQYKKNTFFNYVIFFIKNNYNKLRHAYIKFFWTFSQIAYIYYILYFILFYFSSYFNYLHLNV